MKTVLCCNVDDPTLVASFTNPVIDRLIPLISEWQFYLGQLQPGEQYERTINGVTSPVTCAKLQEVNALGVLNFHDVPLTLELAAIKSWSPTGDKCRDDMRDVVRYIRSQGYEGTLRLMKDEPYTWAIAGEYTPGEDIAPGVPQTPETVADFTATFDREAAREPIQGQGLIEAAPNHEPWQLQAFVEALAARGHIQQRFVWDLLPDASINTLAPGYISAVTRACEGMRAAGVEEIGVIVQPIGTRHTDRDFITGMEKCAAAWDRYYGGVFDLYVVQSWHLATGADEATSWKAQPALNPYLLDFLARINT